MKTLCVMAAFASLALAACGSDRSDVILEGQVFWGPSKTEAVDRAFVRFTDSTSMVRCVVTSCDGTFAVRQSEFPAMTYPIRVSIERAREPEAPRPHTLVARRVVQDPGGAPSSFILFDSEAEARVAKLAPTGSCAAGAEPALVGCPDDHL